MQGVTLVFPSVQVGTRGLQCPLPASFTSLVYGSLGSTAVLPLLNFTFTLHHYVVGSPSSYVLNDHESSLRFVFLPHSVTLCSLQQAGVSFVASFCLRPVVDVTKSYTLAHCGRDSDCGYDGVCGSDGRCRCHFSRAGTLCDVPVNVSGACAPITGVSIACHSGLCSLCFQNWLAYCCVCLGS